MSIAWMRRLAQEVNSVRADSELSWLKEFNERFSTLRLPGLTRLEPVPVHGRPRVTSRSPWLEYDGKKGSCELGDVLWIYECCSGTAPICRAAVWQVKFRTPKRHKYNIDATLEKRSSHLSGLKFREVPTSLLSGHPSLVRIGRTLCCPCNPDSSRSHHGGGAGRMRITAWQGRIRGTLSRTP